MADSLPTMTAASDEIRIGGVPYRLSPLSFRELAELELWVNRQLPDPKAVAREMIEAGLPDAVAEKVALEAFRVARQGGVKINSPEAAEILGSPSGAIQVLYHSLKKHQPNLMVADVERLAEAITAEEYAAIERFVYGEPEGPKSTGAPTRKGRRPRSGGKSSTA